MKAYRGKSEKTTRAGELLNSEDLAMDIKNGFCRFCFEVFNFFPNIVNFSITSLSKKFIETFTSENLLAYFYLCIIVFRMKLCETDLNLISYRKIKVHGDDRV